MSTSKRTVYRDMTPTVIDGKEYYTVTQFAHASRKTPSRIHQLITSGNKRRKLRTIRVAERFLIEAQELCEFPWKE